MNSEDSSAPARAAILHSALCPTLASLQKEMEVAARSTMDSWFGDLQPALGRCPFGDEVNVPFLNH